MKYATLIINIFILLRLEYDLGINGNGVPTPPKIKERKKHDRFNGMPEEEVSKRTLPDHLATNLDIIIVSIIRIKINDTRKVILLINPRVYSFLQMKK